MNINSIFNVYYILILQNLDSGPYGEIVSWQMITEMIIAFIVNVIVVLSPWKSE